MNNCLLSERQHSLEKTKKSRMRLSLQKAKMTGYLKLFVFKLITDMGELNELFNKGAT